MVIRVHLWLIEFFMNPPVRELLSDYLLKRQDVVLRQLAAEIAASPDLEALHVISRTRTWEQSLETLLQLMVRNLADPRDTRCFSYARQALREQPHSVSPHHLLRVTALLRGILDAMLQSRFAEEAPFLHRMNEIIDSQLHQLELAFTLTRSIPPVDSPQRASLQMSGGDDSSGDDSSGNLSHDSGQVAQADGEANADTMPDAIERRARERAWHSETRYFSLFENASEAIISFRPGQGEIVEVNMQAERLLGRPRADLLGTPFIELFPDEHREQARWLVEQNSGNSVRLEDIAVRRAPLPHPDRRAGENPAPEAAFTEPSHQDQSTLDGSPTSGIASRAQWLEVPVSLSCNWIVVEGQSVAQAILRDVTQLRQIQRELQSYAGQLEERVAARTGELQQSQERYRALFLQEQRRAQHLSLINEVQQCALDAGEFGESLFCVTHAIQGHFRNCDVTFFLLERREEDGGTLSQTALSAAREDNHNPPGGDLMVAASAGGHGLSLPIGGRHPFGLGLAGQVALRGETLHYSDEHSQVSESDLAQWRERPPGVYREARAQIGVPVSIDGHTRGVISVQSEAAVAFDARDAVALQTAATIVAAHLRSSRLFREMGELNQFHQALINTMSHSLMIVDRRGLIQVVNDRLCQTLHLEREELLSQPMTRVLGDNVPKKQAVEEAIAAVAEDGSPREVSEVQVWMPETSAVFDLRIFRVSFRGEAQTVVLMINITLRWRKAHQLQMMHEIGRFFQASLDIDKVLYTVLTSITAGSALGFNRAFVLLRDSETQRAEMRRALLPPAAPSLTDKPEKRDTDLLTGAMALGPSSPEEAGRIWSEIGERNPSLQEIFTAAGELNTQTHTPLQHSTSALTIDLENPAFKVLCESVRSMRATSALRDELFGFEEGLSNAQRAQLVNARALFTAPAIAIAPLIAKERVVGVVLADNLFSGAPIDDDDIQLLDTLAQQAGLTIDNALTYQALHQAQRDLVSAERLAAVGEMAARVSHEIRNPLATIGGFARSLLKRPDDHAGVARKTGIIVDEVARLEELLTDLLDMARPRELLLEAQNLNDVVSHALILADADINGAQVEVQTCFAPDLPPILLDRRRLLQAVLNIVRNGAQAMPNGGVLEISTDRVGRMEDAPPDTPDWVAIAIRDHGVGISPNAARQIFDPFFSTKVAGSGLGLAVTRRIIQDHGGDIDVNSTPGEGTTFTLRLPLRVATCELPPRDP